MAVTTKTCTHVGITSTEIELDTVAKAFDAKMKYYIDMDYGLIGNFVMNSFEDALGNKCTSFAQTLQKAG